MNKFGTVSIKPLSNHVFVCFILSGIDWGGLRREWFELLCKALFAHEAGFFTRFNAEDPQALVRTVFLARMCLFLLELVEL